MIILLTDGVNNTGKHRSEKTATELAKELNIKVYTIGIGTNGTADFPYAKDPRSGKLQFRKQQVEIDEELLRYIASETEGQYFRATDNTKLQEIYDEIDKLEKTKVEELKYTSFDEKYRILVFIAGGLLFFGIPIKKTPYLEALSNVQNRRNPYIFYAFAIIPVIVLIFLLVLWWKKGHSVNFQRTHYSANWPQIFLCLNLR